MNKSIKKKAIFIFTMPFMGLVIGEVFHSKTVIQIVLVLLTGAIGAYTLLKDERTVDEHSEI